MGLSGRIIFETSLPRIEKMLVNPFVSRIFPNLRHWRLGISGEIDGGSSSGFWDAHPMTSLVVIGQDATGAKIAMFHSLLEGFFS